jgi:hypothetical protein
MIAGGLASKAGGGSFEDGAIAAGMFCHKKGFHHYPQHQVQLIFSDYHNS